MPKYFIWTISDFKTEMIITLQKRYNSHLRDNSHENIFSISTYQSAGSSKAFLKYNYISRRVKRMLTIRAIRFFTKKLEQLANGMSVSVILHYLAPCLYTIHSDHVTHFTTTCTVHVSSTHYTSVLFNAFSLTILLQKSGSNWQTE